MRLLALDCAFPMSHSRQQQLCPGYATLYPDDDSEPGIFRVLAASSEVVINSKHNFESDGFSTIAGVVTQEKCDELIAALPTSQCAGTRTLLSVAPFRAIAADMRGHRVLSHLLEGLVAVQCTLFHKAADRNWSVRMHRDSVVAISGDGPWKQAGRKEGMMTAKPPRNFLDNCVAVRLHLDGAPDEDIRVVPGSHRDSLRYQRAAAVPVGAPRGGVVVIRPTIVHMSSRLTNSTYRRVLHYLFCCPTLPEEYSWYHIA